MNKILKILRDTADIFYEDERDRQRTYNWSTAIALTIIFLRLEMWALVPMLIFIGGPFVYEGVVIIPEQRKYHPIRYNVAPFSADGWLSYGRLGDQACWESHHRSAEMRLASWLVENIGGGPGDIFKNAKKFGLPILPFTIEEKKVREGKYAGIYRLIKVRLPEDENVLPNKHQGKRGCINPQAGIIVGEGDDRKFISWSEIDADTKTLDDR